MPCTPVANGTEIRKFVSEIDCHLYIPGDRMGRLKSHQRNNSNKGAVEWAEYCVKMESGLAQSEPVYRLASKQRQHYHETFK